MAADILLYQTDLVPVGEDQKQHLELTRDLAESFNKRYGPTFKIPEPYIGKVGARIMSLQNPQQKMSKSDPDPNAYVSIIDPLKKIEKKIKSAVTDSGDAIHYDPENKAGISNLMTIFSCLSGKSFTEIENDFTGKLYGHLKLSLAELVCETLRPVQNEYARLMSAPDHLLQVMKNGAERASAVAEKTLQSTYERLGLLS
jgi:tryptophanyl-tRNA synthetase